MAKVKEDKSFFTGLFTANKAADEEIRSKYVKDVPDPGFKRAIDNYYATLDTAVALNPSAAGAEIDAAWSSAVTRALGGQQPVAAGPRPGPEGGGGGLHQGERPWLRPPERPGSCSGARRGRPTSSSRRGSSASSSSRRGRWSPASGCRSPTTPSWSHGQSGRASRTTSSSSTTRGWRKSLANTFVYAALFVPLGTAVALGLAMLLHRVGRASGFFRTVFYLPVMTPAVAAGAMFLLLLNGQRGLRQRGARMGRHRRAQLDHRPGMAQAVARASSACGRSAAASSSTSPRSTTSRDSSTRRRCSTGPGRCGGSSA